MKAYKTPKLQIVDITTASLLMGSINTSSTNESTFDIGIKTGSTPPSQMTREQSGAGGGLWSDMK